MESLGLLVRNDRARKLAESKLKDDDPSVRAAAATSLGQIGLKTSVPALIDAAHDKEAEVVFASGAALLKLGNLEAYRIYYAVLTGEKKTPGIRAAAETSGPPGAAAGTPVSIL